MKGLSGAVTALILVIASVVIALLVVGFAFGIFGSFSSQGTIQSLGPGEVIPSTTTGPTTTFTVEVTLYNSGGAQLAINSVTLNGVPATVSGNPVITVGTQTLSFNIQTSQPLSLQPGTQVQLELILSNGVSVPISAVVYQ